MSTPLSRRVAAALLAVAALGACAPSAGSAGGDRLNLVGFATAKAGNNAAQAGFAETPAGAGVTWTESYGASGDQSRAVAGGLPADVVHFSTTPDLDRLVDAGLVAPDWARGPHRGVLTSSVVVLVVRAGNPKGITGWDDLARPGVGVVTPNPGSSGAARWNVLAAWAHVVGQGGSVAEAEDFLRRLLGNVEALPGSGRDATTAFQGGTGDVLISYENEAILARQLGEDLDYVVPGDTLRIDNPAAVTRGADPRATAFLEHALSPAGQRRYATKGYRPVVTAPDLELADVEGANDPSDPFPRPRRLFTIEGDLGGWSTVDRSLFGDDGTITRLLAESAAS